MFQRNLVTQMLLAALCATYSAYAHSAGTTVSSSGVPGEGDCTACHTVGPVGTGGVTAVFSDTTGTYQAGVNQHMTVTITDSTAKRWGFQLTARLQSNQQLQAGSFVPGTDSQLFCTNIGAVNYSQGTTCPSQQPLIFAEQTFDGTHINKTTAVGSITYELDWVPPADPNAGTVVMYISGLAANNDGAVAGDITYNVRYVIQPSVIPNVPVITSVFNPSGVQSTITKGEIISIRGTGLSLTSRGIDGSELLNGQYPNNADGVSVTIGGVPAYLMAIDPSRIRAVVPQTDALGLVPVVVTNNGQTTLPFLVDLEPVAPAFFLLDNTHVLAQHLNGSNVTPSSPAAPGETVVITAVGLGKTTPALLAGILVPDGTVANLATTLLVLFNGSATQAQSASLITGLPAGVFAVTVQIPSSAPDGDLPIQLQVNGVQSDLGFSIPVHH